MFKFFIMKIDLCTIDWVAISAAISLLMVIATFITLWQNRKQLNEIKKQWNEERRARLEFSIVAIDKCFMLKIENIGKNRAKDIKLSFNKDFVDLVYVESHKKHLDLTSSKKISLQSRNAYYSLISPTYHDIDITFRPPGLPAQHFSSEEIRENNNKLVKVPLRITGSYLDENNQKYEINEELYINDYMGSVVVDNDSM